jgi:GNAT superfamily N-acetyltransferase
MAPGVRIRLLEPADSIAELTELIHRAYAPLGAQGLHYVGVDQTTDQTLARIKGGECYVAEDDDGTIVGTITFHDAANTAGAPWYDQDHVACFHQFCVDPAHQGRGIGRALLDTIERRARETGARELSCDTAQPATHLVQMYEHFGYRIVDTVDWRPVTNYLSVVLSKTLERAD